jgi:hypothetical protein
MFAQLLPIIVMVPDVVLFEAVTQAAVQRTPSICALSDPFAAHEESDVGAVGLQDSTATVAATIAKI